MGVVRLGRSIPFVPRRKNAAAAMALPPPATAPKPETPGARVEVFHHGAWVGATILYGNPCGATSLRVLLDGVTVTEGHASIPKCLVRPVAAPSVDIGKKSSWPCKKRPLEALKTDSRRSCKPKLGPGIGISRAALERWFEELKPIYPNAQLPWIV